MFSHHRYAVAKVFRAGEIVDKYCSFSMKYDNNETKLQWYKKLLCSPNWEVLGHDSLLPHSGYILGLYYGQRVPKCSRIAFDRLHRPNQLMFVLPISSHLTIYSWEVFSVMLLFALMAPFCMA